VLTEVRSAINYVENSPKTQMRILRRSFRINELIIQATVFYSKKLKASYLLHHQRLTLLYRFLEAGALKWIRPIAQNE
jgi:hypothetical protein